jgi:hypothetical protein
VTKTFDYRRLAVLGAAACVLVLGGCLTPEQLAAQHAQYIAEVQERCLSYGYPPRSPQLAQCVQQSVQADEYRRQAEFNRMEYENQLALEQLERQQEHERWEQEEERHEHDQQNCYREQDGDVHCERR